MDAFLHGRHWRFYGNGLGEHLSKAAEKACIETLQFIPDPHSFMWTELEKSRNENDQRIFSWSVHAKNHFFSNNHKFDPGCFKLFHNFQTFIEKINQVFDSIYLKSQVIELQECPNIFISYVVSSLDWRKELGVPIV